MTETMARLPALVPPPTDLPPRAAQLRAEVRAFLERERAAGAWTPRADVWLSGVQVASEPEDDQGEEDQACRRPAHGAIAGVAPAARPRAELGWDVAVVIIRHCVRPARPLNVGPSCHRGNTSILRSVT